jgi:hypothetical protein
MLREAGGGPAALIQFTLLAALILDDFDHIVLSCL